MKKIMALLLIFTMGTIMIGCNSQSSNVGSDDRHDVSSAMSNSTSLKEESYDQKFLDSLAKGIEESSKLNEEYKNKASNNQYTSVQEYDKYYKKFIETELESIEEYKDMNFENKELKDLAVRYIQLLQKEKQELENGKLGSSPNDWHKEEVYILNKLEKDYGFKMPEGGIEMKKDEEGV